MSDTQLFRIGGGAAQRLEHSAFKLERDLQRLFEAHLQDLLGVRFLATEFITDATHAGRIDTVGLDENNNPVVIEYKRGSTDNVITQGLFYLDWLVNHRADFRWLVLEKLGKEAAETVDWGAPRLICVAESFGKYDGYAVKQMNRSIQLLKYRRYPGDLLALELIGDGELQRAVKSKALDTGAAQITLEAIEPAEQKNVRSNLEKSNALVRETFAALSEFTCLLGEDVELKELKFYFAFRKLKNFVTVTPLKDMFYLWLRLEPTDEVLAEYAVLKAADVRKIGHWGTGDLQTEIRSFDDLELVKPLIERAYAVNA